MKGCEQVSSNKISPAAARGDREGWGGGREPCEKVAAAAREQGDRPGVVAREACGVVGVWRGFGDGAAGTC